MLELPANQRRAPDGEQEGGDASHEKGAHEELLHLPHVVQIAADHEHVTVRQSARQEPTGRWPTITDVVELYDATAEANGVALVVDVVGEPTILGDKDLLASATANLVDNALKYGGSAATVRVGVREDRETVSIVVQDEGPGIAPEERVKVVTRFYRLDRSRSLPGNGLGLAIVTAISHLHGGSLSLEDAAPGLIARIVLPRATA